MSVIIPTYNHGAFLRTAVESVQLQAWPDIEVCVVDDGSKDDTPQQIAALASEGTIQYCRQGNQGPGAARNAGVARTHGQWIAFLDADDRWLAGKLEAQFSALAKEPTAAFCYGEAEVHDQDGGVTIAAVEAVGKPLFRRLLWGNCIATPTVLVRRDCFLSAGGFRPELRTGEDWDLWLRLAASHVGVAVHRPLVAVRSGIGTARGSVEALERATLDVLRGVFSSPVVAQYWGLSGRERSAVYAWHYSVLAKSYLRHAQVRSAMRLLLQALGERTAALRARVPRPRSEGA